MEEIIAVYTYLIAR